MAGMKEDVLEVLLYLFDNYVDDEAGLPATEHELIEALEQAGFARGEIEKAIRWLDDLTALRSEPFAPGPLANTAVRVFTDLEHARLSRECRGFLLFLEQMGVLNDFTRELVIDRVMALDSADEVDVEQLKWIVMMVLFNLPGHEGAFAWVENMDAQVCYH